MRAHVIQHTSQPVHCFLCPECSPLNSSDKVMLTIQDTVSLKPQLPEADFFAFFNAFSFVPVHNAIIQITALHYLSVYTSAFPLNCKVLETKDPIFKSTYPSTVSDTK